MTGSEMAKLFYTPEYFERSDAAPGLVQKTLFGVGGVQSLDGAAHRHRKALFMTMLAADRVAELAAISRAQWREAARKWEAREEVVLYDEARAVLGRSVCEWAGVRLSEAEFEKRLEEWTALFDSAGRVGLGHLKSRWARKRADRWARELVEEVRAGRVKPREGSALRMIAEHRDLDGTVLDSQVAGVELLNVLRPTIAAAVYVVFAAHALQRCGESARAVREGGDAEVLDFVQEVRRYYPFFPAVMARVRRGFEWKGYVFPRGVRVLLDLYGTNRDPAVWDSPDEFDARRFRNRLLDPYEFVPQGGGTAEQHHRCPGEGSTAALMTAAIRFLVHELEYEVPRQDLEIDYQRLPALPRSGFKMRISRLRDAGFADSPRPVKVPDHCQRYAPHGSMNRD